MIFFPTTSTIVNSCSFSSFIFVSLLFFLLFSLNTLQILIIVFIFLYLLLLFYFTKCTNLFGLCCCVYILDTTTATTNTHARILKRLKCFFIQHETWHSVRRHVTISVAIARQREECARRVPHVLTSSIVS